MRRNPYLRALGLVLMLALPLVLAGCSSALLDPKGEIGQEQRTLILTAFGLMQIVVVPVIVLTLAFAWRYRKGNKDATYAPDWHHSTKIEAVVWFIPCVIIVFLALLTWYTSHSLDPHKPLEAEEGQNEPMVIEAVSLDWKWLFIYPEQGIATVNELAFPEDTPVRFRVTSGSVMNSFFIPQLGSQIYAMAGMDNDVHLIAEEQGVYRGRSTNYSGAGFADMYFDAHVGSQEDFDNWVAQVREAPDTLTFPEEYYELAKPTEGHFIKYFSDISSSLYENIIKSFHAGGQHSEQMAQYADAYAEGFGNGESAKGDEPQTYGESMSAEAAE
ncbi:ubiquinol oxidase subunit 2 [Halomonas cupida]|uniref:Ubiquinol oxidase subunit 2 n=1 Tax=Halomonas cupida TaxID=44933 RepID=A0A1M7C5N2_9GAMM|nr:ubiquinol oxidase subunit II [Halomonas cupida]GEN24754.1 ubiquinol oxidase subunit 2 [Halomonas cupida]SHL62493.1 cytochrome o ubiquinol oxidase subunit 2 [Halomonas cupida]